ncbi:MAG: AtpZ/AtpI family protein [Actinomycetota bacterium]
MDASDKRDLQEAIWRSSGGFDLVLAPVIIALLGLWIDSAAGTRPVFMLAFLAFGTVGAVLKVYYDYQRGMDAANEQAAAARAEAARLRAEARRLGAARDLTAPIEGTES